MQKSARAGLPGVHIRNRVAYLSIERKKIDHEMNRMMLRPSSSSGDPLRQTPLIAVDDLQNGRLRQMKSLPAIPVGNEKVKQIRRRVPSLAKSFDTAVFPE